MLTKEKATELVIPILEKYEFSGSVILFGDYPTSSKLKLGLDLNYAKNGVETGIKMVEELKNTFKPSIEVQITSLLALNSNNRKHSHEDLYKEIKKGTLIYGEETFI